MDHFGKSFSGNNGPKKTQRATMFVKIRMLFWRCHRHMITTKKTDTHNHQATVHQQSCCTRSTRSRSSEVNQLSFSRATRPVSHIVVVIYIFFVSKTSSPVSTVVSATWLSWSVLIHGHRPSSVTHAYFVHKKSDSSPKQQGHHVATSSWSTTRPPIQKC